MDGEVKRLVQKIAEDPEARQALWKALVDDMSFVRALKDQFRRAERRGD